MRRPVSFRVATQHELAVVIALGRVVMWPGSSAKRLVRDLNENIGEAHLKITERQAHALDCIAWRYRRQLPAPLRPIAKPAPWREPALTPLAEDPSARADAPLLTFTPAERST